MKVKFVPQNVEFEILPNQTVMKLAHEKGLPIKSVCNGMPSCAECRVRVVEGETNVSPPSKKELSLIGTGYFIDQRRLSCQLYCFGDVTIDLSEQIEKEGEIATPKKFLARANKTNVEDYHSVGDVLLEKEEDLVKEAEEEVVEGQGGSEVRDQRPPRGPGRNDGGGALQGQGKRRRRRRR